VHNCDDELRINFVHKEPANAKQSG